MTREELLAELDEMIATPSPYNKNMLKDVMAEDDEEDDEEVE